MSLADVAVHLTSVVHKVLVLPIIITFSGMLANYRSTYVTNSQGSVMEGDRNIFRYLTHVPYTHTHTQTHTNTHIHSSDFFYSGTSGSNPSQNTTTVFRLKNVESFRSLYILLLLLHSPHALRLVKQRIFFYLFLLTFSLCTDCR